MSLMLQSDPELIHLDEVGQHESNRVLQVPARPKGINDSRSMDLPESVDSPITRSYWEEVPSLPREIMSQE